MSRKNLTRLLIILFLLICRAIAPSAPHAQSDEADAFRKTIQPFIDANCTALHSAVLKSGGLNLEAYQNAAAITQDRDRWEKVLHKLRTGETPPKGMSPPAQDEIAQ